jgi:hypothetical protein
MKIKGVIYGPELFNNDKQLGRVFIWQARIGIAPKFGSRPIGWYQQCQCETIDKIRNELKKHSAYDFALSCRKGTIFAQSVINPEIKINIGSARNYETF